MNTAVEIKNECLELFSSKNIFNNCSVEFINKYKQIYKNNIVLSVLTDLELVQTAKLFLSHNLNISIASKQGYMHRNTLIYRIEKIKKLIGLDIRNFNEAVVFENLVIFYDALIKNN